MKTLNEYLVKNKILQSADKFKIMYAESNINAHHPAEYYADRLSRSTVCILIENEYQFNAFAGIFTDELYIKQMNNIKKACQKTDNFNIVISMSAISLHKKCEWANISWNTLESKYWKYIDTGLRINLADITPEYWVKKGWNY